MLKRLYIDNFRCFVNFEWKPERKQLLLGANGSGKSSLVEALNLLKHFLKGREIPFTQSTRTRWQDLPIQVFEVEASIGEKIYLYRVEIGFSSRSSTPTIRLEKLAVDGVLVFELANGELRSYSDRGSPSSFLRGDASESSLLLASYGNPQVDHFLKWMDRVHYFKIDAYEEKMEETVDAACVSPDWEMEYLSSWYSHLVATDPDGIDAYRSTMREVLPGFANLRFSPEDDGIRKLRVDFSSSSNGKLTVSLHELSDGQRCLIALYMILHFLIERGHTVIRKLSFSARGPAFPSGGGRSCRRARRAARPYFTPS
jgi:energy-coupling factor transporter ATP-binding protein EcfA2